jgi:hypothetical protein
MQTGFKGNKSYLPTKICTVCKKEMVWRKAWEKNWESILYCSQACRKKSSSKKV